MAVLSGISKRFNSYFSTQKAVAMHSNENPSRRRSGHPRRVTSNSPNHQLKAPKEHSILEGDTLLAPEGTLKRVHEAHSPRQNSKRRKTSIDAYQPTLDDSDLEGSTIITRTSPQQMKEIGPRPAPAPPKTPPPATPNSKDKPYQRKNTPSKSPKVPRITAENSDDAEEIFAPQNAIKKNAKEVFDFDQEQARRYAEAMSLPANSGLWAETEKDLFFRLAMRGFEPLLPGNWKIDFKTLPQSLFDSENTKPALIQPQECGDFRAIKALRDLFDTGMHVRDRAFSKHRLRAEQVLNSKLRQYITWALSDAGVSHQQRPRGIPVYAIAYMKEGDTAQSVITDMMIKLHKLGSRHRKAANIYESVEARDMTPNPTHNDTSISNDEDDRLPILTGLMICTSLVIVVTLNAHAVPPASLNLPGHSSNPREATPGSSGAESAEPINEEESGIRSIATFDFSDGGMDVWNALAIAIIVMHIRDAMIKVCRAAEEGGPAGKGSVWERLEMPENSPDRKKKGGMSTNTGIEDPDA